MLSGLQARFGKIMAAFITMFYMSNRLSFFPLTFPPGPDIKGPSALPEYFSSDYYLMLRTVHEKMGCASALPHRWKPRPWPFYRGAARRRPIDAILQHAVLRDFFARHPITLGHATHLMRGSAFAAVKPDADSVNADGLSRQRGRRARLRPQTCGLYGRSIEN